MAVWWCHIFLVFLLESAVAYSFDHKTYTVMDFMNNIYTDKDLLHQRPNATCAACAVRTIMLRGKAFSCQHNWLCLIYSICHVTTPASSTGTWEYRKGMTHFCSSKQ
jgi:hypothetical protein